MQSEKNMMSRNKWDTHAAEPCFCQSDLRYKIMFFIWKNQIYAHAFCSSQAKHKNGLLW